MHRHVRIAAAGALLALLSLAVPSARAADSLPFAAPNSINGLVLGYGVLSAAPVPGVGLSVDPSGTFAGGDLQINLVDGAIPFVIKGVAATTHPGFVGGVLYGQGIGPNHDDYPGYAESLDEQPDAGGADPFRYRTVEKCTQSPNAYSAACDPAEPEYMFSESTREGVPHQTNIARKGDTASDGSVISTSDIRPGPDGFVTATVSTFASNLMLAPGLRVGSIKAVSTSVWNLTDPSKRSTTSHCEATGIETVTLPAGGLPVPVGGAFTTAPGYNVENIQPSSVGSTCQGPSVSYVLPNGDQFLYILGFASSQAGSADITTGSRGGTTSSTTATTRPTSTTTAAATTPAPAPPPPAAPRPPAAPAPPPPVAPAAVPSGGGATTATRPSATPTSAAQPTQASAPIGATAAPARPPAQPATNPAFQPLGAAIPQSCFGISLPGCIGVLTGFTGSLIAAGAWSLRYSLNIVRDPNTPAG